MASNQATWPLGDSQARMTRSHKEQGSDQRPCHMPKWLAGSQDRVAEGQKVRGNDQPPGAAPPAYHHGMREVLQRGPQSTHGPWMCPSIQVHAHGVHATQRNRPWFIDHNRGRTGLYMKTCKNQFKAILCTKTPDRILIKAQTDKKLSSD